MIDLRIVLFLIVIIAGFIFMNASDQDRAKKQYIIVVLIMLILESSLRGISIGSDTWKYREIFSSVGNMSWNEAFKAIVDRYLYNVDDSDAGYIIFQKCVHLFSDNFNVFLFACALCFFIPFGKFLMRLDLDVRDLIFLFVFYVALFNPIAMSGTRKEIALGISILCLLNYYDKRYVRACIWLVLGASIHMSMLAILLIPALNLLSSKPLKVIHFMMFFTIPIVLLASSTIIAGMANFVGNEHYLDYAGDGLGGGVTFIVLMELLLFGCFCFIKKIELEENLFLKLLYCALPVATFFVPLINNNGSMIRLSQYFHIYILFFLPYIIKTHFAENRRTVYTIAAIVLIVLCMMGSSQVDEYYFFWNDPYQNNISPLMH